MGEASDWFAPKPDPPFWRWSRATSACCGPRAPPTSDALPWQGGSGSPRGVPIVTGALPGRLEQRAFIRQIDARCRSYSLPPVHGGPPPPSPASPLIGFLAGDL